MKLTESLSQATTGVSKIRGLVGKACTVVIIVALAVAAMACAVRDVWISGLAIVLVLVFAFIMLWRVISFADRHPEAALLEGGEFLKHQQMILGTKQQPQLPEGPNEVEAGAIVLDPSDPKLLGPDALSSTPQLSGGEKEGGDGND